MRCLKPELINTVASALVWEGEENVLGATPDMRPDRAGDCHRHHAVGRRYVGRGPCWDGRDPPRLTPLRTATSAPDGKLCARTTAPTSDVMCGSNAWRRCGVGTHPIPHTKPAQNKGADVGGVGRARRMHRSSGKGTTRSPEPSHHAGSCKVRPKLEQHVVAHNCVCGPLRYTATHE